MRLPVICLLAIAVIAPACAASSDVRGAEQGVSVPLAQLNLDAILPEGLATHDYGIVLEDLASGARVARNDRRVFPSASLYKLGVAWTVLRRVDAGALSLDAPLQIEDDDAIEVEPDGGVAPGDRPTVREALAAMITLSSNAAAHAFLRVVGRQNVNQELAWIGLEHTRLPEADEDAGQGTGTAVTDAADVARLLRLIAVSDNLSAASRAELLALLARESQLDALRDRPPEGVDILDKTGNLEDASNVAAVLRSSRGALLLAVVDQSVDPGDARTVIAHLADYAFTLLRP